MEEGIIRVTETTYLSPFRRTDGPDLVAYCNDPEIYANTLTFPKNYTLEDAENFFNLLSNLDSKQPFNLHWAIRNKDGHLMGGIGLVFLEGDPPFKGEFGYWLAQPFRSKGIMTDVVLAFSEFCFMQLGLKRLAATVFPDNTASVKVLEKAGFKREGLLRNNFIKDGQLMDVWLYARIRD